MLKITLYKECILSHEYTEVFHHSCFSDYLNTLTKKVINNLDLVYYEKEGTLIFDYDLGSNDNIYEFNYMKVEVYTEQTEESLPVLKFIRYCFISNIKVQNELCYVNYEEDRWQSYSSRLKIRNSLLSRSKFLNYTNNTISLRNLPLEYNGHTPLYTERLFNYSNQYVVVLQMQKYNAKALGDSTERQSFTTVLYKINELGVDSWKASKIHTLFDALWAIREAYKRTQYQISVSGEDYYYQIGNITLIPYNLFNASNFLDDYFPEFNNVTFDTIKNNFENLNFVVIHFGSAIEYLGMPKLKATDYEEIIGVKHPIYHWTVQNDFKNFSIGTMTNQIEIVNNGLPHEVYLYIDINEFNFDIYLEFDKKQVAITNDFVINIPYSYLNGEELSQQKMARAMRNIKAVGNIVEGAVDIGLTVGTAGANKMINLATKTPRLMNSLMSKGYRGAKQKLSDINEEKGIFGGVGSIASGITGLIEANAPNYSSSKGTFSYEDAILNAYAGICIKKIIPQNESYVENFINETGYITYQIGGDEFLANYYNPNDLNPTTENVMKFDFVKAYGKFPQDICDDLKAILLNGFKIIYHV